MPERVAQTDATHDQRLWQRMKWLRLQVGRNWPPGLHTQAQNEWLRLEGARMPVGVKIRRLREWLEGRSDPRLVEEGFAHLERVTRAYGGADESAPRLRVVAPE